MAIVGINESSLATSEIYATFNAAGEMDQAEKARNLIRTSRHLQPTDIEIAYIHLKALHDRMVMVSLQAFEKGDIVLLYNEHPEPSTTMTQAIPFLTMTSKKTGRVVTYIFMDKYVTKNRDGVLNVQAAILRDLLQGALISNALKTKYSQLSGHQYMQMLLTRMYVQFCMRIINREFSIGAEKAQAETVEYWISRFFLTRVLIATDNEKNIQSLSTKHIRYLDETSVVEITNAYKTADPKNVTDLINLLREASPRMKSFSMPTFVSKWVDMYYTPSMLAIDNVEYLVFMILSLLGASGVINPSAGDIVRNERNIKNLKEELSKLI